MLQEIYNVLIQKHSKKRNTNEINSDSLGKSKHFMSTANNLTKKNISQEKTIRKTLAKKANGASECRAALTIFERSI